jgi:hypothetical protein
MMRVRRRSAVSRQPILRNRAVSITAAVVMVMVVGVVVLAQGPDSEGYKLSWWTVDGGGETFSTGAGYSLGGTAGQPDAGPVMSGGDYQLTGGFWPGGGGPYRVYLPVVLRGY